MQQGTALQHSLCWVWHGPDSKPGLAGDKLGAVCEMRFFPMVKNTPDSLIHTGDRGAGKGGRECLGLAHFPPLKCRRFPGSAQCITQRGWGQSQAALPMPHVPSGSHILAMVLPQALLPHYLQQQCLQEFQGYNALVAKVACRSFQA